MAIPCFCAAHGPGRRLVLSGVSIGAPSGSDRGRSGSWVDPCLLVPVFVEKVQKSAEFIAAKRVFRRDSLKIRTLVVHNFAMRVE